MNTERLSLISRVLLSISIFGQIFSMIYFNNALINPIAYFIYLIAMIIMIYVYYNEDDEEITTRNAIKILNTLGIVIIIALASLPSFRKMLNK
jgi:hypothetical protein